MLQFQNGSVDLIDEDDWLDLLLACLPQDGLSLNTDSFDAVNNDQRSISDSQGGSDFRREIDVPGTIDQVDQVRLILTLVVEIVLIEKTDSSALEE